MKQNVVIWVTAMFLLSLALAGQAARAGTVQLRLAHANAPTEDSMYQVVGLKYKELVEKYSNGEMTVAIFPSGQLGGEEELVSYAKEGSIDFAVASLNQVSNHAPGLEALFLPYMFPDTESMYRTLDGTADYFNEYLPRRANMRIAGYITGGDYGYRQVLSLQPVKNLADLRRLKVRVPANPVMTATFQAFGITPTPIAWGELFNALQTGVVDAFECDVSVLVSARYNEVVKYVTDINYVAQISLLVMSNDTYGRLSPAHKKAIDQATGELNRHMRGKGEEISKQAATVSVKVRFLGKPDDFPEWEKAGRSTWPKFYGRIGDGNEAAGKELVDKVFAASRGK
ncbi:MAG: TRAP transporter substrate-binding protein [Planctomycetota bacterium]|jgi:TRAP-type C4-dicarboxylate transport system substrate-binding protein|nr:TRAP transporter substrate-binding protein [Planctomycetota bacterium]